MCCSVFHDKGKTCPGDANEVDGVRARYSFLSDLDRGERP